MSVGRTCPKSGWFEMAIRDSVFDGAVAEEADAQFSLDYDRELATSACTTAPAQGACGSSVRTPRVAARYALERANTIASRLKPQSEPILKAGSLPQRAS